MPVRKAKVSFSYGCCCMRLKLFTELMEYALTIHCKFSFWMCKFLPAYGSKTEMDGPSAVLIIKALVHATTMHTDATVLRVGAGGCGARVSSTAFSSHAAGLAVPRETGSVLSYRVVTDDNEEGVENMAGRFACHLQLRVIIRVE